MRFANPEFLWLLLLLPAIAAYFYLFRSGDVPSFRFSSFARLHGRGVSFRASGLMALGWLRIFALALIVLALARPQKGLRTEEMTTKATDIMFCLDASRSMTTIDFKPQDRFQVAKSVITDFIKGRAHDRMGITLFAEHAVTMCPLTSDESALLDIVERLAVGAIPSDRTAIGVGIATSVNRLKDSQAKSKVVILLTDGSNNAGSIDPLTAAKSATAFRIKIYTIGAGSPEGGMMPYDDPVFGRRLVQTTSDLDEEILRRIADETGGKYFRAKSGESLKTIFKEIDAMEKTEINVKEFVDYEEFFGWFLLGAVLIVFTELTLAKTLLRTMP